jgi:hypothetical protein
VAELSAQVSMAQNLKTQLAAGSATHVAWQEVVRVSAAVSAEAGDRTLVENLLVSQWSGGEIKLAADVTRVLESWRSVRVLCAGGGRDHAA